MKFYLGTHEPLWLRHLDIPLFVSRQRFLRVSRKLPRARCKWALDSGAFMELFMHGRWTISHSTYVALVRRLRDEVGNMEWAAPQDWMCEPFILAKTGADTFTHQRRTCRSVLALRESAPDIPWIPVLQGYSIDDYKRHVDLYQLYRIDLKQEPVVGLGSVCRRQSTKEVYDIVSYLYRGGIRVHGFGFKMQGVAACGQMLESCDSLAWSFQARRLQRRWCHNGKHKNCANCQEYALDWRRRLLAGAGRARSVTGCSLRPAPKSCIAGIAIVTITGNTESKVAVGADDPTAEQAASDDLRKLKLIRNLVLHLWDTPKRNRRLLEKIREICS